MGLMHLFSIIRVDVLDFFFTFSFLTVMEYSADVPVIGPTVNIYDINNYDKKSKVCFSVLLVSKYLLIV